MRLDQQRNVLAARKLAQQRVFRMLNNGAPAKGEASSHQYTAPTAQKRIREDARLSHLRQVRRVA
jgi:hypothetical protein